MRRPLRTFSPPRGGLSSGWVEICASSFLRKEDVIRFDHEDKTYAIYRTADGNLYATDGICTHGNAHLADGFVSGTLIECAKHNGRFDITDGSPRRQPVCVGLKTYKAREHDGKIFLDLASAGGCGLAQLATTYRFRVVSNDNVATFIKELVLEPEPGSPSPDYQPGDYLQFDIPAYDEISFHEIAVNAPFAEIWKAQDIFDFHAENALPIRRNFSMATNPGVDQQLRFNVRISTPPRGPECSAGAGSTYLHRLKPGDEITAIGPFGDFPHQADRKRNGVSWRRRRHGPPPFAPRPSLRNRKDRTPRQLLVWRPLVAGEFLPGLLRELGRAIPQLQLPPRAVRARSPRTTGNPTPASSTRSCGKTISPTIPIPPASNTISAARLPWSKPPSRCWPASTWTGARSPSTSFDFASREGECEQVPIRPSGCSM